jgi:hypothetical protein
VRVELGVPAAGYSPEGPSVGAARGCVERWMEVLYQLSYVGAKPES